MPSCILHIGTPKTGTSAIQQSLYFGLSDPRFRYVSMGLVNPELVLSLLFSDKPQDFWLLRRSGCTAARMAAIRRTYEVRLRRALGRARAKSQTPIISAEYCWRQPEAFFLRLKDFLASEGFDVRIIVYLRPIKSFIESRFQQVVMFGQQRFEPFAPPADTGVCVYRYAQRLEMLEQVVGRHNLVVRPFTRSGLSGGCAVRDFCNVLGIDLNPASIIRSNESSSLDAVRLMYAYNRYRSSYRGRSPFSRHALVWWIKRLKGTPFRFHSSVMSPVAEDVAAQVHGMRDRYGIDISEDYRASDDGPCVREESDLFRFSPASLEWLAKASGLPPIASHDGEAIAREVATHVEKMQRRLGPLASLAGLRFRLRGRIPRLH